ncbi:MAG: prenyltransferase [Gemmatimonadota bacterium]|nr:MAG: prenyltransferase [Gemmatimonadota bacterium]
MSVAAYAGVARAPFLLLPITLAIAGTGAAAYLDMHDWAAAALALLGLLGMHVAVNALNEASDYRTGIDFKTRRTPFSGGSGTLPAGRLGYGKAVATGLVGGAIGIVVGVYFLTIVGWKLVPVLAIGALAIFGYSEFLARAYVGELFAGLGLGALPVIGTTLVQTGDYEVVAIAASIPAFFMTFNLLLLNEFPDEEADREGGRRNLVLLLGRRKAALLYSLFAILVPVALVVGALLDILPKLSLVAILPSLILLPKPLGWAFKRSQDPVPIPALGSNVIWNLATNTVLGLTLFFCWC